MIATVLIVIYLCGAILALKYAELLRMASTLLHDKRRLEERAKSKILKNSTGEKVCIFVFWPVYLITLYFT